MYYLISAICCEIGTLTHIAPIFDAQLQPGVIGLQLKPYSVLQRT